jgi:SAM-dependent methyltransferase
MSEPAGWTTFGTEYNPMLNTHARHRGHTMLGGTLDDVRGQGLRLDALTAWEVLEHLPEPQEFLLAAFDVLRPGGVLGLVVPNDFNPLQLEAQQRHGLPMWWVALPDHLSYWGKKSLQLLVRRCGFDILDMYGTYPMERFMVPADPSVPPIVYVGDDALGRQCHERRMAYELDAWALGHWEAVEAMYREDLAEHGIGREIVLIARRRIQ